MGLVGLVVNDRGLTVSRVTVSRSLSLSIFSQIASRCLNSDFVILNGFVFKSEFIIRLFPFPTI